MKKLRLHAEAEAELAGNLEYYLAVHPDVADRFFKEITESFGYILRQPKIGAPIDETYRKFVTPHFRYIIIYKESAEEVRVDAIGHYSRKPGYWGDRR